MKDGYVLLNALHSEIPHAISSVGNHTAAWPDILKEGQPCEQEEFRRGLSTMDHIHTNKRLKERQKRSWKH
ncbi:hypothetical protein DICVIV_08169 [Dictyocaulus viviparus]|uniref:Uncharacterized protein n=1 Tax=Dictyocaulus viviparus TaxID=29172 RepID=A0A0D8XMC7_DICVI|nr:hypothetical protein DICVIV_08169 [Dictyocaulus viviparus]